MAGHRETVKILVLLEWLVTMGIGHRDVHASVKEGKHFIKVFS